MSDANPARYKQVAAWGTVVWLAACAGSALGWFPLTEIEQLFLLSPLIAAPLGFEIVHGAPEYERSPSRTPWGVLIAGGAALAACALPPGRVSGALAAVWALITVGAAGIALRRLLGKGVGSLPRFCYTTACLYLPVGGLWFAVSRLGMTPMGFEEPIVLLTAVHFHNSGFAAPILVGAAVEKLPGWGNGVAARAMAAGVIAAPALIAAGFVISPALKLLGALLLSLALAGLALVTLARSNHVTPASARMLLRASAGSVIAGMVLASIYAAGDFTGRGWISIPAMAASHGVLNGVGFVLCGLVAWTLASAGGFEAQQPVRKNNGRNETRVGASQLPGGRDLSADIWRDGWSN